VVLERHDERQGRSKATAIQTGTWAYHQKQYGADFPYQNLATQFRAELFDPDHWADVFQRSGARYVALTSQTSRGFRTLAQQGGVGDMGTALECGRSRTETRSVGRPHRCCAAQGSAHGLLLFALRVVQPAVALGQAALYKSAHDSAVQGCGDAIQAGHHLCRWRVGAELRRMAHAPSCSPGYSTNRRFKDNVVINDRWGSDTRHKHGGYWTTEYTPGMAGMDHPWEESRGMGFSYGYNRAERLEDYHSSRELLIMLVDLVSRGGNLLLDIGPNGDGAIPVIMEERLIQMGKLAEDQWRRDLRYQTVEDVAPMERGRSSEYRLQQGIRDRLRCDETGFQTRAGVRPVSKRSSLRRVMMFTHSPRWPDGILKVKEVSGVKSVTLLGARRR